MAPDPTGSGPAAEWPACGAFDTRAEFQAAVRGIVQQARARGVRRMWWVSPTAFEGWPVDEPALLEALTAWAGHRAVELTWLSGDFEALRRDKPRLTRWRQNWAHRLTCLSPLDLSGGSLDSLLLVDEHLLVQVNDLIHWRGRISDERQDIVLAKERLDAVLQRSAASFPVTTLGI